MAFEHQLRDLSELDWLTTNRARNQAFSFELFRLLKASPNMPDKLVATAHLMIGATFSLWRAVFLADFRSGKNVVEIKKAAEDFLETLIRDNAINYPQDRGAREWSFGYYLGSAQYRLRQIMEMAPEVLPSFDLKTFPPSQLPEGAPTEHWETCQAALEGALANLARICGPSDAIACSSP